MMNAPKTYPYMHDGTSSLPLEVIKKYIKKSGEYVFVETGTNLGAGVQRALDSEVFKHIYSIEIEPFFYEKAIERFRNNDKVTIIKGDANIIMPVLCKSIEDPIFIFSDGHNDLDSSIRRDMEAISNRNNPKDILTIDDIRIFHTERYWAKKIKFQELVDFLTEKKYNITFEDTQNAIQDLLVATKGE